MKYFKLILLYFLTFTQVVFAQTTTPTVALFNPGQKAALIPKNYALNGGFELGTAYWKTYNNSVAGVTPDSNKCNAGTATATLAFSGTTPLSGKTSGVFSKPASNVQGNGISLGFKVDPAAQGRVLQVSGVYQITSGTYSGGTSSTDSDVEVYVFDQDTGGAVATQLSSYKLQGAVNATTYNFSGAFQTNTTASNYRLCFHVATTSASAYTLKIDDVAISTQVSSMGPAMSDWAAYTPTFTGFGSVTNIDCKWARIGSDALIRCRFTSGTATATEARVTLPPGMTSVSTITTIEQAQGFLIRNAAAVTDTAPVLIEPSVGYVTFGGQVAQSGTNPFTKLNGSALVGNAEGEFFYARVPIAGLSSNSILSSDTDTRVISFFGTQASQALTANVTNIAFTTVKDTHGAWNGTQFTAPVPGDYMIAGTFINASVTTFQVYKNGSAVTNPNLYGASTTATTVSGSMLIPGVVSGDVISVRSTASVTITNSTLSIFRLSGPAQIAASESVNARYFASATALSGSLATISWTTKDFDSHSAMSAGTYTVPSPGKYLITAAIALTAASAAAGNAVDVQIQKNGTVVSEVAPVYQSTQILMPVVIGDEVNCVAGDTLRVQVSSAATTPAITSSNSKNFFSITRVGN